MEKTKKKKNKSIGKIFTNKRTVNVLIFIAFLALLYMVYNMIRSNNCEGDDCKNVNVTPAQFLSFLLWVIAIIAIIVIVIPTIVFLIYGKSQQKLDPSDRDDPFKFGEDANNDEIDEEEEDNIPDFNFETADVTSSCPNRDNSIEGFANRNKQKRDRYHVDGATGKMSTTRNTGGTIKKIEIPEYPNVNSDKWIHISKIPDMKNYVHKKDLPCMANYVHKKEIPNMSEYIHKTKVPPVKTLKKTAELPDGLDADKLAEIKKIFGIDMNNYILKTAIPQCLKCPDINDYVLKSSVPPF